MTDAESPGGDPFGKERLQALLVDRTWEREPEEILDRMLRKVAAFSGGRTPADDVTLLVVRYRGEV